MASPKLLGLTVAGLAGVALVGGFAANQIEARHRLEARVQALTGGDPQAGQAALGRRPCGACHEIPGVAGATGTVGPPLVHFAARVYIGGRVQNTPDNLVQWILDPHATDPQTAMPAVGVSEREARDIAAYLYTLK